MADRVFPAHDAVGRRDLLDRATAAEPQGAWRGVHLGVGGGRCFDAVRPHGASGSRLWTINGQPPANSDPTDATNENENEKLRRAVEVQTARLRGGRGGRGPASVPPIPWGMPSLPPRRERVGMGQAAHRVQDPRATTMVKGTVDRNQPVAQRPHGTSGESKARA